MNEPLRPSRPPLAARGLPTYMTAALAMQPPDVAARLAAAIARRQWRGAWYGAADQTGRPDPDTLVYCVEVLDAPHGWTFLCSVGWRQLGMDTADAMALCDLLAASYQALPPAVVAAGAAAAPSPVPLIPGAPFGPGHLRRHLDAALDRLPRHVASLYRAVLRAGGFRWRQDGDAALILDVDAPGVGWTPLLTIGLTVPGAGGDTPPVG